MGVKEKGCLSRPEIAEYCFIEIYITGGSKNHWTRSVDTNFDANVKDCYEWKYCKLSEESFKGTNPMLCLI